jgi:hypothetical protein
VNLNDTGLPLAGRDSVVSNLHVQYPNGSHRFLDHFTKVDRVGWLEITLRENVYLAKGEVLVLWVKGVTDDS